MSKTLTLSGNSSLLTADYFPPIELDDNYACALVDFSTYHSIPNIDVGNNLFYIGDHVIEVPVGSYELDDIAEYLENECHKLEPTYTLTLQANHNTLKSEIFSNKKIYFNKKQNIGSLLGFSERELEEGKWYSSDLPLNISKINIIRIECNIVVGSYINNQPSHTIHEFPLNVSPGYKIDEVPRNAIYLPLNTTQISSLSIKIVDQSGNLINFRGETITLRLHIKPSI